MNITVPVNRKRIPLELVTSCLFIWYLLYDAAKKSKQTNYEGPLSWIVYAAIILILLYYAAISLTEYIKTLFDKNASLIITDSSIVDNLSIFSCGEIAWENITDIKVRRSTFAEFLIIKVQDPSKYLRNKNIVQRRVLKRSIKKTGSPIVISDQLIRYDLGDLQKILLAHKNK